MSLSSAADNHLPRIDIVIPVYKNLMATRLCIESVLASQLPADTHIIVIEDASPESEVADYCRSLAQQGVVQVRHHTINRGFVVSVNEGMSISPERDVVLLNSDTQVVNDWLVRLQTAAYSTSNIGTVTPFSNNGSICSYPRICESNDLSADFTLAEVDRVFSRVNKNQRIEIPTAVGFCMYIRRACLASVGLFDAEAFGRGYGEENDFCLRASAAGWQHLLAADIFVYHQGSMSFGEDRHPLMRAGEARLALRYPEYAQQVGDFIQADPIKKLRISATNEMRRIVLAEFSTDDKPRLLFITHQWGGGVEQHIADLIAMLRDSTHIMILRGMGKGRVEFTLAGTERSSQFWQCGEFDVQFEAWLDALKALSFSRIHLHHVHGWSPVVLRLIEGLNIPLDITLHDYYCVSPRYHLSPLTGSRLESVQQAQSSGDDLWPVSEVEWQQQFAPILARAERVIAPSHDVATRISSIFPDVAIVIESHPEKSKQIPRVVKVALLGALSSAKGLDLVCRLAANTSNPSLCFRLIGHSAEPLPEQITTTGSYEADDLVRLIAEERPDVIWMPSQVHETFGYTLSAALVTGLPIVASAVGAFVERLRDVAQAQLLPVDASDEEWLTALVKASSYKHGSVAYKHRSFADYYEFYAAPLHGCSGKTVEAENFIRALQFAPGVTSDESMPLASLFRIGVYGGHRPSLKEFERLLARVASDEVDVVGRSYADELRHDLDTKNHQVYQLRDGIRQYELALTASQNKVDEVKDGLRQYREALEAAQIQLAAYSAKNIELVKQVVSLQQQLSSVEGERDAARSQVMAMVNSTSWKLTRPLRLLKRILDNLPALSRRLWRTLHRPSAWSQLVRLVRRGGVRALVERLRQEVQAVSAPAVKVRDEAVEQQLLTTETVTLSPMVLVTSNEPVVSIVIPVYGQHVTTYNCLASIAANPPSVPYEVIIADDTSPEPASEALAAVEGIRIERNPKNVGFLGNMNAGVKHARGEWLVLLNNDTLLCRGAIDALLRTFVEHDNVGLVGAKLLNRDGSVQEAGGIIWRDGSGWNWGRNQHRDDPRFNFVREADYCSGAVLALRRELFADMGGFDTHFAPAYYEDTDLAFRMRARGLRVLYQPAAEVYHLEGVSHGTDTNTGVKAYQTINAEKFYNRWHSVLTNHNENADQPEQEAHRATKGNILVVDACMITPDQDSGSIRMLNLMVLLKREGYHVSFVADNLEYRERYVEQLQQLGVEVYYNQWVGGSIRTFLKRVGEHLKTVILSRHYIARKHLNDVRMFAPNARVVFDTVDLHFVREEREAKLHGDSLKLREALETREQELSLAASCDFTLVVSEFEKKLLFDLVPESCVEIVSNIHSHKPERPDYNARQGIIFVGGFRHAPNVDAINWYVQEVVPHLRDLLPGVKTQVIGSNMPLSLSALACEDLEMLGFIESIEPNLQMARVSIAPLRYGAGVKGKVNEAMNYGIPVVATACAVEGMYLRSGEEVIIAEDARSFAEAIARVYGDEKLWLKLSVAGVENVRRHFSPEAALPALMRVIP